MIGFIYLVSAIFILIAGLGLILSFFISSEGEGFLARITSPAKRKLYLTLFSIGGLTIFMMGSFYYAQAGYSYLVQFPWGTQKADITPGLHAKFWGQAIPFKKYVTIGFADKSGAFSGLMPAQEVRFNDSVTANVEMTARFKLPEDEEMFRQMAVAFRTQDNLVRSSLAPILQESMRNSARMMSAQEYISGKGGEFEYAILDQVKGGLYVLEIREERNYAGKEDIAQDIRNIDQDQTVRVQVSKVLNPDGSFKRKGAEALKTFGILLDQANIQDVDPDPDFKAKLKKQRDAAAQVAIERQNTRMEEERKKRIIAQGEADKAERTVELEKDQIEKVIAAETKAKEAEQRQKEEMTKADTNRKVAQIDLEKEKIKLDTAKVQARQIDVLAEAEAQKRKKLMAADGALDKRLDALKAINQYYARALTHRKLVPDIVIGAQEGGDNSAKALIDLITANTARQLGVPNGVPRKK